MAWSADAVRELWGRPQAPALIVLLTVTSPALAQPLRLAAWDEAVVSLGRTFEPFPFVFQPASTDTDLGAEAEVEIAVTDARMLAGLDHAEAPVVRVEMIRAAAPDEPEVVLAGARAVRAEAGIARATISLRARPFADEPACQARYTPSRVRGLF